ncbi:hypothetical protein [Xylella fastidiosa]|uniref:hypothetical protein n=1 Tax=Xylella fastidiosa TaxID=2371 RepID=UPI000057AE62|nr:hypothetical protein [Xylella fastidiosa]UIX80779.1 hypothetical protein LZ756_09870 [Xylella fastidiosa subsp. sandyi]
MQRPFPERNRDAHGAGQRFPDHSKTPNHPTTQPPNHPITQLPNYPITQLPNDPSGKQQHSLSNATAGQGRPYRAPLQLRASSAATVSTSRRCNTSSCLADLLRIIRDSLP